MEKRDKLPTEDDAHVMHKNAYGSGGMLKPPIGLVRMLVFLTVASPARAQATLPQRLMLRCCIHGVML